jgi:hypothetical protein
MTARDGGRRRGDEDMVVVINDRRTLVSGSTANGDGGDCDAIAGAGCSDGGWDMAIALVNVTGVDGAAWLEDECRDRVVVDACLFDCTYGCE